MSAEPVPQSIKRMRSPDRHRRENVSSTDSVAWTTPNQALTCSKAERMPGVVASSSGSTSIRSGWSARSGNRMDMTLFRGGHRQVDGNGFPYSEIAPVIDSEIMAVHLGFALRVKDGFSVHRCRGGGKGDRHPMRLPFDGQKTGQDVAFRLLFDRLALEGQLRIFRHLKEIRCPQMLVSVLVLRVDTGRLNHHMDRRLLRGLRVELDPSGELVEAPIDGIHTHVADGKSDFRPRRVD